MWANGKPNVEKSYSTSFGDLPEGTVYSGYDPSFSKKIENIELKRHIAEVQKAAIANRGAGTASLVGVPIYLDRALVDITARETPVRTLIPRMTARGRSVDYDRIIARARANWKPEDANMIEAEDTYQTKTKLQKYLYAVGRVTGPLFAASKERVSEMGFGDWLNLEVVNKTTSLIEDEENSLINGNYVTTNNDEPLGILKEILDNGNSTNRSGAEHTISDLDEMIRICRTANDSVTLGGEMPNLFLTDFATENKLKGLFYETYRINAPVQTWGWGMQSAMISGVPVLGSRFMTAAAGSRNLALLNTKYIESRVLQDITYEELAKTNDSDKFMLKEYLTFVVKAPEFMNLHYGL